MQPKLMSRYRTMRNLRECESEMFLNEVVGCKNVFAKLSPGISHHANRGVTTTCVKLLLSEGSTFVGVMKKLNGQA